MLKYYFAKFFLILAICLPSHRATAAHNHGSDDQMGSDKTLPALSVHNASVVSSIYSENGRLWLAWVHGLHVYVNHSDDDGVTFSLPVKVNKKEEKMAAHGESRPKITIGSNGYIYIAYTQKLPKRYTGNIRFSRSQDNGTTFSAPITVNSDTDIISHRFVAMVVNAKGDIYLSWLDARDAKRAERYDTPYQGSALYAAVSVNNGESFQMNSKIQDNSCQCCRIAMGIDQQGNPIVLWRQLFGENIRDHALTKLSNSATSPTLTAAHISRVSIDNWAVDACPHHGPALFIDANGTYHLTWFTGAADRLGLHYARSTDHGRSFIDKRHFGNNEKQSQHPDVYSFGNEVYIVWKEFDGTRSTLKLMKSINHGRSWSADSSIASASGPTDYPFFLVNKSTLKVAWLNKENGLKIIDISRTHHE